MFPGMNRNLLTFLSFYEIKSFGEKMHINNIIIIFSIDGLHFLMDREGKKIVHQLKKMCSMISCAESEADFLVPEFFNVWKIEETSEPKKSASPSLLIWIFFLKQQITYPHRAVYGSRIVRFIHCSNSGLVLHLSRSGLLALGSSFGR